jgi:uncharacterized membrane protein YgcG
MKKTALYLLLFILLMGLPIVASAQSYYFQIPQKTVDVYWNEDGTLSLNYIFVFKNDPSGHIIDYVDVGLPNSNFDESSIVADVDGVQLSDISRSGFQGEGSSGVAVGLGSYAIPAGKSGVVSVYIGQIRNVLHKDKQGDNYASAVFTPNYYVSSVIYGSSDTTVIFHLPPGVQPDEPRWHNAPSGFPLQPETGFDDAGRITYTWHNPNANGSDKYEFGASFPMKYVPASSIVTFDLGAWLSNINLEQFIPCGCISFFFLIIASSIVSDRRRRLEYVPPKIFIEGHGIKRGLTAVEAAILLEQPLDKVMTMILFSTIKKNAAIVISKDPLKLNVVDPLPSELHPYEVDFLNAFKESGIAQRRALQATIVNLVKGVTAKVKGFSRKETLDYYKSIIERAWKQVEDEDTPEVKSQLFDQVMEWTMLDKNYDERTQDVFRHQPVFIPVWWGRYDPAVGRMGTGRGIGLPSTPSVSGRTSLPTLPGADFAASIVTGVQTFSGKVIGNLTDFTSGVTNKTNPPPKTSSSGGGGGRSSGGGGGCACACACAGCACACAGGGR